MSRVQIPSDQYHFDKLYILQTIEVVMTVTIGVDSKYIELNYESADGVAKHFKTVLGIAVVTNNYSQFEAEYNTIIQELIRKYNIDTSRKVLSSHELLNLSDSNILILEEFYNRIKDHIYKLNIIYTSFDTSRIPLISTYGRVGTRKLNIDQFYNEIKNSFPHICVWKIFQYINDTEAHILFDSFSTKTTNAWEIIRGYNKLRIFINGDKSNCLISTADIIIRVLEHRINIQEKSFYPPDIAHCLRYPSFNHNTSQLYIKIIDNRDYPKITPLDSTVLPIRDYIQHPVYYIIIPTGNIDLDSIVSTVPKLMNEIYVRDGCVTGFSSREHIRWFKEGDVIISLDSRGETDITTLRTLNKIPTNMQIKRIQDYF